MSHMNKKGMAEIVTTLLLVAITIASVTLAGASIYKVLNQANPQNSPEYACLDLQLLQEKPVEVTSACLNQEGEVEVRVKRSALFEGLVSSMKFEFSSTIPESTWTCDNTCGSCILPEVGQAKTYFFTLENPETLNKVNIFLNDCAIDERILTIC